MKKSFVHGGNIREIAENYNIPARRIIDFSSNVNPLGTPPEIKKIIIKNINGICHYPDPECKLLKEGLSKSIDVNVCNLQPGNGTNELIYLLTRVLAPKRVLIPIPSFSEYERAAVSVGAECRFLNFRVNYGNNSEFKLKVDKVLQNIDGVTLIFICNPNNPTGLLLHKDEIEYLIKKCEEKDVCIVIDEAFIDFTKNSEQLTMVKIATENKNVVVLRSLTKFFAIAGLRLGYLVGCHKFVEKISKIQPTWSVNYIAQLAGRKLVREHDFIKMSKRYVLKEKEVLFKNLKKISWIKPYKSSANFILCKIRKSKITSSKLKEYCIKKESILIRDCSSFRGLDDYFFRVAVRRHNENKKLIYCLNNIDEDRF